jgi:hypothetical protein
MTSITRRFAGETNQNVTKVRHSKDSYLVEYISDSGSDEYSKKEEHNNTHDADTEGKDGKVSEPYAIIEDDDVSDEEQRHEQHAIDLEVETRQLHTTSRRPLVVDSSMGYEGSIGIGHTGYTRTREDRDPSRLFH